MTEELQQGVVVRQTLSATELAAIRSLAQLCERDEGIDLRINWGALESRSGEVSSDFLYYKDGALVGFLTADGLGFVEAEATGMVYPSHRRQGVWRALVAAAQTECLRQDTTSLILIADQRSRAAKPTCEALGARYIFSEHKMELAAGSRLAPIERRLDFRPATVEDAPAIAAILAEDFGSDAERVRPKILTNMQRQSHQYYIARLHDEPVGTVNIQVLDDIPYIYGFVVRPEYRGHGYGREILVRTIEDAVATRPQTMVLEVESENTPALSLYRSCGFVIVTTHDYYRLEPAAAPVG